MRKIRKLGPLVLGIYLSSCTTACKYFDWEPRPYVGVSANLELMNIQGETIKCDQPAFDRMTCFDEENIAELKSAIGQVENKKTRKRLQKAIKSLDLRVRVKP